MYNFLKLHKVAASTEKALGCAHDEDFPFLNLYVQCLSNIVEAFSFFFWKCTICSLLEMNAYFILFTLRWLYESSGIFFQFLFYDFFFTPRNLLLLSEIYIFMSVIALNFSLPFEGLVWKKCRFFFVWVESFSAVLVV